MLIEDLQDSISDRLLHDALPWRNKLMRWTAATTVLRLTKLEQKGAGMAQRLTIIQGHPDPTGNRFCHALADAYGDGAKAVGNSVARVDIARIDFPILRTQHEFETGRIPAALAP